MNKGRFFRILPGRWGGGPEDQNPGVTEENNEILVFNTFIPLNVMAGK